VNLIRPHIQLFDILPICQRIRLLAIVARAATEASVHIAVSIHIDATSVTILAVVYDALRSEIAAAETVSATSIARTVVRQVLRDACRDTLSPGLQLPNPCSQDLRAWTALLVHLRAALVEPRPWPAAAAAAATAAIAADTTTCSTDNNVRAAMMRQLGLDERFLNHDVMSSSDNDAWAATEAMLLAPSSDRVRLESLGANRQHVDRALSGWTSALSAASSAQHQEVHAPTTVQKSPAAAGIRGMTPRSEKRLGRTSPQWPAAAGSTRLGNCISLLRRWGRFLIRMRTRSELSPRAMTTCPNGSPRMDSTSAQSPACIPAALRLLPVMADPRSPRIGLFDE
jgi:hypothetical protein